MSFFYDLNKRLADLAKKQDAKQITESAEVAESKFSKLAKEIGKNPKVKNPDAVAAAIGRKKYGQKAMTAKAVAGKKKAHEELDEKWAGDTKLNPEKKGMFKGKTKAELEKQLARLHKTGPHKKGSPEYTKQQELNFAIRAKSGWPKGKTNEAIPMTLEDGISTFESTPGEYINIKQGMTAPKKMTDIMRGTKLPQKIQKQGKPTGSNPLKNVDQNSANFNELRFFELAKILMSQYSISCN